MSATADYPAGKALSNNSAAMQRQVIRLYQVKALSYFAVGDQLGISRHAVAKVIRSAGCQRTRSEILALPHVRRSRIEGSRKANLSKAAKGKEIDARLLQLCI